MIKAHFMVARVEVTDGRRLLTRGGHRRALRSSRAWCRTRAGALRGESGATQQGEAIERYTAFR
jgi:hypothetical protein